MPNLIGSSTFHFHFFYSSVPNLKQNSQGGSQGRRHSASSRFHPCASPPSTPLAPCTKALVTMSRCIQITAPLLPGYYHQTCNVPRSIRKRMGRFRISEQKFTQLSGISHMVFKAGSVQYQSWLCKLNTWILGDRWTVNGMLVLGCSWYAFFFTEVLEAPLGRSDQENFSEANAGSCSTPGRLPEDLEPVPLGSLLPGLAQPEKPMMSSFRN